MIRKDRRLSPYYRSLRFRFSNCWDLYIFLIPMLAYFIIFHYAPMYGLQIAFKTFKIRKGIWGSPWADPWFYQFERLFSTTLLRTALQNTLMLSLYSLIFGFLPPIILALMLNQVTNLRFKKFVQTVSYAPHFISVVVMVSMLFCMFSTSNGIITRILGVFGLGPYPITSAAKYFRGLYVGSDIWQNMGFSAIIYIAALSSISPELHEAAVIDGANKAQRVWHVDIPGILPTITILLILRSGSIMSVGFQKVYLMQTPLNLARSEILSTYVYKVGLEDGDFSFSTAVGMFNSVVNFILIVTVNAITRRLSETSLW
ncbi:MAG: sugar ABC transporter permease [Clostridia bacterium]|nr:sugar ABC transporter permease [Clostridia bacterium]MBQ4618567.1 sugar ABC transporter permease [Clostridia bacterium]MBQ9856398.1 sugar ABC transporter permease [Clostridia bacterium]